MAWTTPRTWVAAEVVTETLLNTHLRDNLNFLALHHGCRVYKTADQGVPNGNTDVVTWNAEDYDSDAFHDTATNNSRVTVPTGFGGFYLVTCKLTSDADAANNTGWVARIRKNAAGSSAGGTLLDSTFEAGSVVAHSVVSTWQGGLVAGDYVEAFATSVGEQHNVLSASGAGSYLQVAYLGA